MKVFVALLFMVSCIAAEKADSKPAGDQKLNVRAYEEPKPTYHAPAPTYNAPATTYNAPSHQGGGYEAPTQSGGYYYYYYPVTEYGHKEPEYHEETGLFGGGLDVFGPLAAIILVIIVIALFFPTALNIAGNGRSNDGPYMVAEDLNDLTNTVVGALESEQCLNRIMCHSGALFRKVKYSDLFINFLSKYAPDRYTFSLDMVKAAMHDKDSCTRFTCDANPYKK